MRPLAKKNSFFSKYQIVYRHSPILLKCAVLVTLVLSIAALTVLRIGINRYHDRTDALRVEAAQLEQENQKVARMTEQKDTVDGIKTIAKEKMDMVDGDTVFYDVVTNQD